MGSETTTISNQTPGKHPKENITYKTRRKLKIMKCYGICLWPIMFATADGSLHQGDQIEFWEEITRYVISLFTATSAVYWRRSDGEIRRHEWQTVCCDGQLLNLLMQLTRWLTGCITISSYWQAVSPYPYIDRLYHHILILTVCITISLLTLTNYICTAAVEDWRRCDGLVLPDISKHHSTFITRCQDKRFFMLGYTKI
jgi:hypothetical protein